MAERKKVVVHGSYFADNYGDTLLVKIMCDKVAQLIGRENVYLAVEGHAQEQARIGYPVASEAVQSQVSHIIYGGGGYLGERGRGFIDNLVWSARNYKRHLSWRGRYRRARTAVIGAGFGPLSNAVLRTKICRLVNEAEVVLLRDQESLNFMRDYGVDHPNSDTCVDLALSLPIVECERTGVAVHAENLSEEELGSVFRAIRSSFGVNAVDVIFDNAGGDTSENRRKYDVAAGKAGIEKLSYYPYVGVEETLLAVTKYALVITSKLHVGITTIAQGGRVISIPSHQKTIRLYRQLSVDKFCIPRNSLSEKLLRDVMMQIDGFLPNREVVDAGLTRVDAALVRFLG